MAHAGLAMALVGTISFGWSRDREGDLKAAEEHATRALALYPRNDWARLARGILLGWRGRYDEALAVFDRTIADFPDNVSALAGRARVRLLTDRPAEALADLGEAMSISPRNWNLDTWHEFSGIASLMLGRDEDAVGHFLRARAANPGRGGLILLLASAYQLTGRTEEARAAWDDYVRQRPHATIGGTIARLRRTLEPPSGPSGRLYRATVERQIDAFRAIGGMPEG